VCKLSTTLDHFRHWIFIWPVWLQLCLVRVWKSIP